MLEKHVQEGRTIEVRYEDWKGEEVREIHTFFPARALEDEGTVAPYALLEFTTSRRGFEFHSGSDHRFYPVPGFEGVDVVHDPAERVVSALYKERAQTILVRILQDCDYYGHRKRKWGWYDLYSEIQTEVVRHAIRDPKDYSLDAALKGLVTYREQVERELADVKTYADVALWDAAASLKEARTRIEAALSSSDDISELLTHVTSHWEALRPKWLEIVNKGGTGML